MKTPTTARRAAPKAAKAAKPAARPAAKKAAPGKPDFSMFADADVANVLLQRSEVGHLGPQIRDWMAGNDAPLLAHAREHRDQVLADAYAIAERECGVIIDALGEDAPARVADIGCGYAMADLVLWRRYGCDLVLIDIEEGGSRHFGYEAEGAGYTSLARARAFLEANGVPAARIRTVNPKAEDTAALGAFDLVISLISCGFHYPVNTYRDLFAGQLNPGGSIVLDIRKGSGGVARMKRFGEITVLQRHAKHAMVLTRAAA